MSEEIIFEEATEPSKKCPNCDSEICECSWEEQRSYLGVDE